jgi:hypothetical protein
MVDRRVVVWGPATDLTTTWTPPCGAITDARYGTEDNFPSYWHPPTHLKVAGSLTPAWESSCGPPGWYDTRAPKSVGYFSPGICPVGYTAACTWYATEQGPPPSSIETAYNCLPYGYTCDAPERLPYEPDYVNRLGYNDNNGMLAPMFFIRWQSSDLSILETDPLTPGKPSTRTVSVTVSATPTSTSNEATPTPATTGTGTAATGTTALPAAAATTTGTISRGAIAGVAVGSVAGLALLIAAVVLLWKRRRRDRIEGGGQAEEVLGESDKPPELDASNTRHEMYAENNKGPYYPTVPAELPVDNPTFAELPSEASASPRPAVVSWLSELSSNPHDESGFAAGQQNRWTASTLASSSPVIESGQFSPPITEMAENGYASPQNENGQASHPYPEFGEHGEHSQFQERQAQIEEGRLDTRYSS